MRSGGSCPVFGLLTDLGSSTYSPGELSPGISGAAGGCGAVKRGSLRASPSSTLGSGPERLGVDSGVLICRGSSVALKCVSCDGREVRGDSRRIGRISPLGAPDGELLGTWRLVAGLPGCGLGVVLVVLRLASSCNCSRSSGVGWRKLAGVGRAAGVSPGRMAVSLGG